MGSEDTCAGNAQLQALVEQGLVRPIKANLRLGYRSQDISVQLTLSPLSRRASPTCPGLMHVAKPVDAQALVQAIKSLSNAKSAPASTPHFAEP